MDTLSTPQTIGLLILGAVLIYGLAQHFAGKKIDAAVAEAKAAFSTVEKRVEDYTDTEAANLTAKLVARLADTSDQVQIKADADAVIARRTALLARIQSSVASIKTPNA